MPLKITLKVGEDEMTVEADAMDPAIVDLAKAWVGALPPHDPDSEDAETAEQIRSLTGDIRGSRTTLGSAVEDAQPFGGQPTA